MTRFPAFCFKKLFATVLALYFVFSLSSLKAEEAPSQDSVSLLLLSKEQPSKNEELTSKILEESPSTLQPHHLSAATLPFLGSLALGSKALPGLRPLFWSSTQRWWLKGLFSTLALGYLARKVIPSFYGQNLDLAPTTPLHIPHTSPVLLSAAAEEPAEPQNSHQSQIQDGEQLPSPQPASALPAFPRHEKIQEATQEITSDDFTALTLFQRTSLILKSLFQQHILYQNPDFYPRLSRAVLTSLLHSLDPEKIFYTQEYISTLSDEFGDAWLKELAEHSNPGLLLSVLKTKEKIAQKYLSHFHNLSQDPSEFSLNKFHHHHPLDLPTGVDDFPQNEQEQELRWSQRHQFIKIIYRLSQPQKSAEELSLLLTKFYEKRQLNFEVKDPRDFFASQLLDELVRSVFTVLSPFSTGFDSGNKNAFILSHEDSSVQLHNYQGFFRVITTTGALKERGDVRPGDLVIAASTSPHQENAKLQALLFQHNARGLVEHHTLKQITHDFARTPSQSAELILILLRKSEEPGKYNLLQVPAFKTTTEKTSDMKTHKVFSSEAPHHHSTQNFQTLHPDIFNGSNSQGERFSLAYIKIPSFDEHSTQQITHALAHIPTSPLPGVRCCKNLKLRYQLWRAESKLMGEVLGSYSNIQDLTEHDLKSVVIDLRNNTGGYLWIAMVLTQLFENSALDHETRLPYEFTGLPPNSETADRRISIFKRAQNIHSALDPEIKTRLKKLFHLPLVILVNENTASAAEFFAAELRALKRVLIVGAPTTAGKGVTVNQFMNMSVSWQKAYVSDGTSPQEVGVPVDIPFPTFPEQDEYQHMNSLLPPRAFLDQELSLKPTPKPRRIHSNTPNLRDPELIRQLKETFHEHLQTDYFLELKAWKEKQAKERIHYTLSLNPHDYNFYHQDSLSYHKTHPPTPPKVIGDDIALYQALWLATIYADLLEAP